MNLSRAWARPWSRATVGGMVGTTLALPLLAFHFAWDQGCYSVIADSMLRGGTAYLDCWEFRPPGGFFAYYATFFLFGRNEWGIRVLEVLCVGLSSAGLVRFSERRFASTAAGFLAAAILPLLHVNFGHWHTAEPESFQMPLIVWALALWPRRDEFPDGSARLSCCGLLLGGALVFKTPVVLFAAVLGVDCLFASSDRPDWAGRLRPAALFIVSFAAPMLAVAAYYTARGALPEFIDAVFVFGPKYVKHFGGTLSPGYHVDRLREALCLLLPVSGRILLGLGILRTAMASREGLRVWAVVFLAALAQLVLQMKYIPYHHHLLTPWLSAGLGLIIACPRRPAPVGLSISSRRFLEVSRWAILALGVVFVGEASWRIAPAWKDLGKPFEERAFHQGGYCWTYWKESERLAEAIDRVTGPDDKIFLWANNPLPYFHSRRAMAGPYCGLLHFLAPWVGKERLYALLGRLSRERPRLVVIGADDGLWMPGDGRELLKQNPEMEEFLNREYRPAPGVGKCQFWLRADP